MRVTINLEEAEEILSRDVSDETLELVGTAGQAGGYTLQYCTSVDCGIIERTLPNSRAMITEN